MIRRLLVVPKEKRLTIEEALAHPFLVAVDGQDAGQEEAALNVSNLESIRDFAKATYFRKACLSVASWTLTSGERSQLRQLFVDMDQVHLLQSSSYTQISGGLDLALRLVLRSPFRIYKTAYMPLLVSI